MTIPELVLALTPFVSLAVTTIIRALLPKIPGPLLPVIAGAIGVLPDAISAFAHNTEASPLKGFLAGCAAVAIHQVKVQLVRQRDAKEEEDAP